MRQIQILHFQIPGCINSFEIMNNVFEEMMPAGLSILLQIDRI